jgi:hypothetical protein
MGRYSDKLRAILNNIPKDPRGFTPEIASMCIAQLGNTALQIISRLEESMEDLEKENGRLTEMLLEKHPISDWTPFGK